MHTQLRLVFAGSLRYSGAVQSRGPGIAKADRPGSGAFSNLLDEDLADESGGSLVLAVLEDLDALIAGDAQIELSAREWGTPGCGGASLIRSEGAREPEILRVAWNRSAITSIRIESRLDLRFEGEAAEPPELMDRLVPMLWSHIQAEGELPDGIERFAGFLSMG